MDWVKDNFPPKDLNAVKLRRKPPLLLERVGVRRIKNKEKYFILIPSS